MSVAVRASRLGTLLVVGMGCGGAQPEAEPGEPTAAEPAAGAFEPRIFERNFVFASLDEDSVLIVPWLLRAEETRDSVQREARGWLSRGGVWEHFFAERWSTGPGRAVALPLPHGNLSFLVRDGAAIEGVVYEEGERSLELSLETLRASWTSARAGSYAVLNGAAYLADQRVEGVVLDMTRVSTDGGHATGDWMFLVSGDSAAFVLAGDREHAGDVEPVYRGWASYGSEELQWPEVRVDWWRAEAYPPARRDIPVAWRIWSADGFIEGALEAVSADVRAGDGPGPLRAVLALYDVTGELSTVRGGLPVRGILVHERR